MKNALSVDVEDYWVIQKWDWLQFEDAVPSEAVLHEKGTFYFFV